MFWRMDLMAIVATRLCSTLVAIWKHAKGIHALHNGPDVHRSYRTLQHTGGNPVIRQVMFNVASRLGGTLVAVWEDAKGVHILYNRLDVVHNTKTKLKHQVQQCHDYVDGKDWLPTIRAPKPACTLLL